MKKTILLAVISIALSTGCSKKSTPDCEANKYGTVTVTFGNAASKHAVTIGPNNRVIFLAAGVVNDTFHLPEGNIPMGFYSTDNMNNPVNSETHTIPVTSCSENTFTILF